MARLSVFFPKSASTRLWQNAGFLLITIGLSSCIGGNGALNFSNQNGPIITATGGNAQSGQVNTPLAGPLTILLQDPQSMAPLPGVAVSWTINSGSGTLAGAQFVTDSNGKASAQLLLGVVAGPLTITVSVQNSFSSVTFNEMANPGPVSGLIMTGPASIIAGQPFAVTVKAVDSFGNLVPSYSGTVALSTTDPAPLGMTTPHTYSAGDGGSYTFANLALGTPSGGSESVTAAAGSLTATASINVSAPLTCDGGTYVTSSPCQITATTHNLGANVTAFVPLGLQITSGSISMQAGATLTAGSVVLGSSTGISTPPQTIAIVNVANSLTINTGASMNGNFKLMVGGNLTINANGQINADGLGYPGGTPTPSPTPSGAGPGGGAEGLSNSGGDGGGHGGIGGTGASNNVGGGWAYDNSNNPQQFGSGGGLSITGAGASFGGNGGGFLAISVTGATNFGSTTASITANGTPGTQGGGGGAGGSILLLTGSSSGTGTLSANGGAGGTGTFGGGGGGGGMIYTHGLVFSGTESAAGGSAGGGTATAGAPGTAF